PLIVRCGGPFPGEDILTVAVNEVSEGVALGLTLREVTALQDRTFCDLCPFLGVREFQEGRSLGELALASNFDAIDQLAVFPGTSFNRGHARASHDRGDTGEPGTPHCPRSVPGTPRPCTIVRHYSPT